MLVPPLLPVQAALGQSAAVAVLVTTTQPKPFDWQPAGAPAVAFFRTMEFRTLRNGVFTHEVAVTWNAVLLEFGENCRALLTTSLGLA